jgi:hypothetical protein
MASLVTLPLSVAQQVYKSIKVADSISTTAGAVIDFSNAADVNLNNVSLGGSIYFLPGSQTYFGVTPPWPLAAAVKTASSYKQACKNNIVEEYYSDEDFVDDDNEEEGEDTTTTLTTIVDFTNAAITNVSQLTCAPNAVLDFSNAVQVVGLPAPSVMSSVLFKGASTFDVGSSIDFTQATVTGLNVTGLNNITLQGDTVIGNTSYTAGSTINYANTTLNFASATIQNFPSSAITALSNVTFSGANTCASGTFSFANATTTLGNTTITPGSTVTFTGSTVIGLPQPTITTLNSITFSGTNKFSSGTVDFTGSTSTKLAGAITFAASSTVDFTNATVTNLAGYAPLAGAAAFGASSVISFTTGATVNFANATVFGLNGVTLVAQSAYPGTGTSTLWENSGDGRLYFGGNVNKLAYISDIPSTTSFVPLAGAATFTNTSALSFTSGASINFTNATVSGLKYVPLTGSATLGAIGAPSAISFAAGASSTVDFTNATALGFSGVTFTAQTIYPGTGVSTLWENNADGRLYYGNTANKLAYVSDIPSTANFVPLSGAATFTNTSALSFTSGASVNFANANVYGFNGITFTSQSSYPGGAGTSTLWENSGDGRLYFGGSTNKIAYISDIPAITGYVPLAGAATFTNTSALSFTSGASINFINANVSGLNYLPLTGLSTLGQSVGGANLGCHILTTSNTIINLANAVVTLSWVGFSASILNPPSTVPKPKIVLGDNSGDSASMGVAYTTTNPGQFVLPSYSLNSTTGIYTVPQDGIYCFTAIVNATSPTSTQVGFVPGTHLDLESPGTSPTTYLSSNAWGNSGASSTSNGFGSIVLTGNFYFFTGTTLQFAMYNGNNLPLTYSSIYVSMVLMR